MKKLGKYLLLEKLGAGATAQVYLAKDELSGLLYALKVFHPSIVDRAFLKKRLLNEIRMVKTLDHECIVKLVDTHLESSPPAIAYQYIKGHSLEDFQARLPFAFFAHKHASIS